MCTHFIKIWDGCAKKHERNMGESKNYERTRKDTKGRGVTTKSTKHTKKMRGEREPRMDTNGHERQG